MKKLDELLINIHVEKIEGSTDVSVSSISLDSHSISNGTLFVALVGNTLDGHDFIDEVIKKGAKVIVHEKEISSFVDYVTYVKVLDTHKVVGEIASCFYGYPSEKLKLIGVTGTNGKTTTVTLLHQLFRNLGHKAGMIGTVVNKINDESFEAVRTTPDAVTLAKLLADMVEAGCDYCFMEVSSHSVSEKRIAGLVFYGGVFTNLTLDHLDYHKSFENYRDAKKEFFDNLPETSFTLSNSDDPNGRYILENTKAQKYFYGFSPDADFNEELETKLIGRFNAYNALAIYATAVLLDEDRGMVRKEIKVLEPVEGRFQYIKSESGITGIVDYAHTPDALENVLKTIIELKGVGKVITVCGCGGDRDKSKRPLMAKIAYDMSDVVILTSDNPRTEQPIDILSDMQKGLPAMPAHAGQAGIEGLPQDKVEIIVDRKEAIKKAYTYAGPGDYVLIAGKGHEKYQEINGTKTHFDDMEELKKYLV
jgi:UDP-N-acetylmuramoyl-L-alanyl-D-glutamate--2,6-diaminopimelate ligase